MLEIKNFRIKINTIFLEYVRTPLFRLSIKKEGGWKRTQLVSSKQSFNFIYRNVAQLGSAPCSGRGGRRFKSCHSDFLLQKIVLQVEPTVYPQGILSCKAHSSPTAQAKSCHSDFYYKCSSIYLFKQSILSRLLLSK